jgi:Tol biopolymer transport system component
VRNFILHRKWTSKSKNNILDDSDSGDVDGDNRPDWSPDSKKLLFTQKTIIPVGVFTFPSTQIFMMDSDGENQKNLTNNTGINH